MCFGFRHTGNITDHAGRTRAVLGAVDAASGTFGVRLELENEKGELPAGLKCGVSFPGI
jgi:hypothetical protein